MKIFLSVTLIIISGLCAMFLDTHGFVSAYPFFWAIGVVSGYIACLICFIDN